MAKAPVSRNFAFMAVYEPQFDRLGALAERYFTDDPNTCLIKLRQFAELMAQETAARSGLFSGPEEPQSDLLRRLRAERAVPPPVMDLFHQVRLAGDGKLLEHRAYIRAHGEDMPEIRDWRWVHKGGSMTT